MAQNPYYYGPSGDHFDGTRFFNPDYPETDRSLLDLLRWRFNGKREQWPESVPGRQASPNKRVDRIAITMIGHASLLVQTAGQNILVDPVWSERASPVQFAGPKRVNPPGVDFDHLPPIDAVLITHTHYDHLDANTIARLWKRDRPRIIAALGTDVAIKRAAPGCEAAAGDWGDSFSISNRVSVTLHPANHWSARSLGDRRMALWCGFVIQADHEVIYVAGDTGYGDGRIFRQVRERFGRPSVAVLPIGAYEPRWFMTAQHVNPDEAVRILLDCDAAQALGTHWGTFQLTDEGRLAPVDALREACERRRVLPDRFVPMSPGDVWTGAC